MTKILIFYRIAGDIIINGLLNTFCDSKSLLFLLISRSWDDAWATAGTRTITCINQEKGGLDGQGKACPAWTDIARAKF